MLHVNRQTKHMKHQHEMMFKSFIDEVFRNKKTVMNLTKQDFHQICNVTSILRQNGVESFI